MMIFLALVVAAWAVVGSVQADESPPMTVTPSRSRPPARAQKFYEQGKASIRQKDFTGALGHFTQANRLKPNDADILNMLAYSHRKLGRLDEAFTYYRRALKLRPRFAEAREYLGEAHIQAAVRQIKTLQGYGKEGQQQAKELIEALKQAVAMFEDDKSSGKTTPPTATRSHRR